MKANNKQSQSDGPVFWLAKVEGYVIARSYMEKILDKSRWDWSGTFFTASEKKVT